MKDPKTKVAIVHSITKCAWNIIGVNPGGKYKIARVPYLSFDEDELTSARTRKEAHEHALFICFCFNNSDKILNENQPK